MHHIGLSTLISDEAAKQVEAQTMRSIALRLLPLIGLSYVMAYMDRANVSFAAVQMNVDLDFSATVYGLGAGLFFAGYSLFEIPSNLMAVRFGPRIWIARIMATWGLISAGMLFVETPTQFYVMRFLLGVAEAGFFPCVLMYLSYWFPAAWRGRAVSRFYIAVPLSSSLMGALAGVLLGLDGNLGLQGWQWLFLLEGLPAVVMAGVLLFLLPDTPERVAWLNADQKAWLAARLKDDVAASGAAPKPFARVVIDRNVLLIGSVMALGFACSNAVIFSAPALLMQITGWIVDDVGYLLAVSGILNSVLMLIICHHSDHHGSRHGHIAVLLIAGAVASIVLWWSVSMPVSIGAYLVYSAATLIFGPLCLVLATEVLHPESRAVGYAAVNTIAQVGNFSGPILWGVAMDATGTSQLGFGLLPIVLIAAALLILVGRLNGTPRSAG